MFINAISILGAAILMQLPSGGELEKIFWDCDYTATISIVDSDTGAVCSIAGDKLKAEKFNGSYSAFMDWWRTNKDEQYKLRK